MLQTYSQPQNAKLGLKFLYIEDDDIDQLYFRHLAKKLNVFEYEIASSLEEAMDLLKDHTFDLIISDFFIGNDSAEDVVDQITTVPIVLVSGLENPSTIQELYQKGIKGHFTKPIPKEALLELSQGSFLLEKNGQKAEVNNAPFQDAPNYNTLDSLCMGSEEMKSELLAGFVESANLGLTRIPEFVSTKDWSGIGREVHRLKSNLPFLGLSGMAHFANTIETNCANGPLSEIDEASLQQFLTHLQSIVDQVKQKLGVD